MERKDYIKEYIILLLLSLILIFSNYIIKKNNSKEKIIEKISYSLIDIQNCHDSISDKFLKNYDIKEDIDECEIFVFKNDSLTYWSSNINDPEKILKLNKKKNVLKQGNNYYFITLTENDSLKLFCSTPLYYENQNLENKNKFLPIDVNGSYELEFEIKDNSIEFNINYQAKMNKIDSYIIGLILILILLQSFRIIYFKTRKYENKKIIFFCISCVIYLIIIFIQNKLFISTSELFGKSCIFENKRFTFSLGSLAEFSALFLSNIIIISSDKNKEIKTGNFARIVLSSSALIFILLIYTYFIYILISNINIPFSFLELFNTTVESYIVLFIIGILTCGVIILIKKIMQMLITEEQSLILSLTSLIIIGVIFEIILKKTINLNYSILTNIVGISMYLIIIWEKKTNIRIKRIICDIIVITLMSTQLTYILYLINETKEREEMEWFANVVGDESDKTFEEEIIMLTDKLKNDVELNKWSKDNNFPSDDSILSYLSKKYFNTKKINEYNIGLTLCDTSTILIIRDMPNYEIDCFELFKDILDLNHNKKISEELTLVDDPTTDSYYILKIDLSPTEDKNRTICYIEFYKEYILNYVGIPEIISSYENVLVPNLVNYSFSCYEDNILQYKYGFYNYPNELDKFRYKNEEYIKTRIFKHLTKTFDEHKTIIITIEKPRFIEIIAPFSYIFIIISLMFYFNVRFNKRQSFNNLRESFHGKMQMTIIMTLGFSFLVAGFTSFVFMRNSLNNRNMEFRYEKNKTIVKNIEEDFNNKDITDDDYLKRFKENYFTDINIYDINGYLINSTQPKLFDGFRSKIINRKAYEMIKLRKRFFYSTEEEIDRIRYNSSYFPLRDKKGELHAIINIPYFDNKMTSKSSMSNFIITYLNVILVLMGLSTLVVILMTRKTIKPLEMIQEKMQKISLGGRNEEIEWKSDDEIGELIEIYNRLIKELEISANKLMRSERETAWREMARQVAHEIKNPLTPMKLNIQFLQMAWDEKHPEIDRKIKETTKTLLEQIEILSNIATAFSDYAKLPKNNIETFNIKELIIGTINLYDNNTNIEIEFIEKNESDYIINSDKNNLGIVFGNIIKNAIQAVGKKEDGKITLSISDLGNKYHIEIEDNGCGIKEEVKKMIFLPNFTTKSSGMGIGLSIVYDILQTLNGEISFESEVEKGTTFKIEIKK